MVQFGYVMVQDLESPVWQFNGSARLLIQFSWDKTAEPLSGVHCIVFAILFPIFWYTVQTVHISTYTPSHIFFQGTLK